MPDGFTKQILTDWDKRYLWHPFTPQRLWCAGDPLVIARAEGEFLYDIDGAAYVDGVSSLWCNVHGHCRQEINQAIIRQLGCMAHTTMLGLTHEPGIRLAKALIEIAPRSLTRVFYSDDGSTATEIAAKMAFQFWYNQGQSDRQRFISFTNAYHGDTVGAVSLGGIDLFHEVYRPLLFSTDFVPAPYAYRCPGNHDHNACGQESLQALERMLAQNSGRVAAVILEPRVQGAAGMITQPPGFVKRVRVLTEVYDTLLIADEVATGFGRTGMMFACADEQVTPDIMCVAKGISGGYLPMAATMTTEAVYNAFLGEADDTKTFYHGHTYTGNPLACAAALASLDLFSKDQTLDHLGDKIRQLEEGLARISEHRCVGEVRQCGMMAGIELVKDCRSKQPFDTGKRVGAAVCDRARAEGVILRPLGDVVVIMPPLAISGDSLERIISAATKSIEKVTSRE